MRKSLFISCIGVLAAGALQAQEVPPFTFSVGGGFVEPMRTTGHYTDLGWNAQAGAGFNFNPWVSALIDFNFSSMGVNPATLDTFGAPGGTVQIWSFTLDPVIHLTRKKAVDVYVTGGGGIYHRLDQLTEPAVGFTPVITPFGFFNAPFVGNQVLASYSVNKPGADLGLGVAFGSKWRAKFYAEARYNRMFTSGTFTDFLPVTFGVRF